MDPESFHTILDTGAVSVDGSMLDRESSILLQHTVCFHMPVCLCQNPQKHAQLNTIYNLMLRSRYSISHWLVMDLVALVNN